VWGNIHNRVGVSLEKKTQYNNVERIISVTTLHTKVKLYSYITVSKIVITLSSDVEFILGKEFVGFP
jgi:hypothetical protein